MLIFIKVIICGTRPFFVHCGTTWENRLFFYLSLAVVVVVIVVVVFRAIFGFVFVISSVAIKREGSERVMQTCNGSYNHNQKPSWIFGVL